MLVIVIKDYYDLQSDKELRKKGQLLEYKSEKRANELLVKGFVRRVEIQEIEDPEEVKVPEEAGDTGAVEETEETEDTEEAEEAKEEVKKRPTKK